MRRFSLPWQDRHDIITKGATTVTIIVVRNAFVPGQPDRIGTYTTLLAN